MTTNIITRTPSRSVQVSQTSSRTIEIIKRGAKGDKGDKGDAGYQPLQISAVFNALSPVVIDTVQTGTILTTATINILEAFDGVGANVSVGTDTDHEKYIALSEIDITQAVTNHVAINHQLTENETIKLFLNAGTLATGGKVYIRIDTGTAQ